MVMPQTKKRLVNSDGNKVLVALFVGALLAVIGAGYGHVTGDKAHGTTKALAEHVIQARIDFARVESTIEALRKDVQDLTAKVAGLTVAIEARNAGRP